MYRTLFLFQIISLTFVFNVFAKKVDKIDDEISIEANNGIEFLQESNMCIAKGEAVATKDDTELKAEIIKVYFTGGKKKEIKKIEAYGNVSLKNPTGKIVCSHISYFMPTEVIEAKSDKAKSSADEKVILTMSDGNILQASDKIIYSRNKNEGEAFGDVEFRSKDSTIKSPHMKAFFYEKQKEESEKASITNMGTKSMTMEKLEAFDGVSITNGNKKSESEYACYFAKSETAKLSGNVKITEGKNIAIGDNGTYDIAHKKFSLIADKSKKKKSKVKALIIYQDSKKKREK